MYLRRVIIPVLILGSIAFSGYLYSLYGQLDSVFTQQEQSIPTRIYSDVYHLIPPVSLAQVQKRLKALGYDFSQKETEIRFKLHPLDYPGFLIPEGHPIFSAPQGEVLLTFLGGEPSSGLQSLLLNHHSVPDLYLEPELVATLSRGKKEIRELVHFPPTEEDDYPAYVWKALISIEDQHFMDHRGLDPRGIARAIYVNLKTLSFAQGGSTITQQLVKNLMARKTKNIFRKINELFLALLLEARYEKEQILERYLNEVYLGQVGSLEIHGVKEGAKHFFGKKLKDLTLAECALMAGLIRGPGFYSPYRYWDRAIERQRLVLKKMVETGHITEMDAQEALNEKIRLTPAITSSNKAPFFADFVRAELLRQLKDRMSEEEISEAGFRVYSTLDMDLNQLAQESVAQGILELEKRLKLSSEDRLEGALASVDHTNGFIRALIGGKSYSLSNFNRILNMKRQVGSTFKPLVYLTAFLKESDIQGIPYSPGYPVEDAPWKLTYDRGKQSWAPKNYEKEFLGWITMRDALAHSVNTVASKLGYEVGIKDIIEISRKLGIESELPEVPSLSLGVAELSPIELLRAYATIANHGEQQEYTVIRAITQDNKTSYFRFVNNPSQVIPPGPADLLTDVLQSVFTSGTARIARTQYGFDRPAAGKTGTTSNYRDTWFAGYTPQLTTVVWVGLDHLNVPKTSVPEESKKKLPRVMLTGATGALPIWAQYMKKALEGVPPTEFSESPHLSSTLLDRHTGKFASADCPEPQTLREKILKGQSSPGTSCEILWPQSITETTGP